MKTRVITVFVSALWACAFAMAYVMLFEATRSSPLASASAGDWTAVVGFAIATSTLFAVLVTLLCLPFIPFPRVTRIVLSVVLWLFLTAAGLMAVENFSYIMFGVGLRTEQASSMKFIYLAAAAVLALPLTRLALAAGRSRGNLFVGAVAIAVAVVYYGSNVSALFNSVQARVDDESFYNVVILSADGLNAEWLSAYGENEPTTPFLSSRVEEFALFQNAYTPAGNTTGSITALLTGQSPLNSRVVYPPDVLSADRAARSLPEILGHLGYFRSSWAVPHYADPNAQNLVDAFDSVAGVGQALRPGSWMPGGDGLDRWFANRSFGEMQILTFDAIGLQEAENPFDQITATGSGLSDPERLDGVLEEIGAHERFFINSHFMDTHGPRFTLRNRFFTGADEIQEIDYQENFRNDALRDFDQVVELVYGRLQEVGVLERTILVVTADHGRGWDATRRIPLMIRFPEQANAGTVRQNVSRLDIAPTILEAIGVQPPEWMDGTSMLGPLNDHRMQAAVTVIASEHHEGGNLHLGGQVFGPNHLIVLIQCDSTAVIRYPFDDLSTGRVGDDPTCTLDGPTFEQNVRNALSDMRLGEAFR